MDNQNQPNNSVPVLSVGDWVITILIAAIPVVNIIMLFVWGFGSGTNPNKANWAKATLIWMAIFVGLYAIFFAVFGTALISASQSNSAF